MHTISCSGNQVCSCPISIEVWNFGTIPLLDASIAVLSLRFTVTSYTEIHTINLLYARVFLSRLTHNEAGTWLVNSIHCFGSYCLCLLEKLLVLLLVPPPTVITFAPRHCQVGITTVTSAVTYVLGQWDLSYLEPLSNILFTQAQLLISAWNHQDSKCCRSLGIGVYYITIWFCGVEPSGRAIKLIFRLKSNDQ